MTYFLMCAGKGQLNSHRKTGEDYSTVSFDKIVQMCDNPARYAKQDGFWFIPSTYNRYDARSAIAQYEDGRAAVLWADIDKGDPSIEHVIWAVQQIIGSSQFLVHSSHNHSGTTQKWHVIVPLEQTLPVNKFLYPAAATAFNDALETHGLNVDRSSSQRLNGLCYLPNPSASFHYHYQQGGLFTAEGSALELAIRQVYSDLQVKEPVQVNGSGNDLGFIGFFNRVYPLELELPRWSFISDDGGLNWHWQNQTTGSYATLIKPSGKAHTLSGSVAAYMGTNVFDSFDMFAKEIGREQAMLCAKALPYGWRKEDGPNYVEWANYYKQLHHHNGYQLLQNAHIDGQPFGSLAVQQRDNFILEQAQETVKQLTQEHIPVAQGEWELDWPPGMMGEIARHIYQNARKPVKQYAIAMAFYLMAGIAGRRFMIGNMGLNLYMVLAGPTGTGKGSARSVMNGIIADIAKRDSTPAIYEIFAYEFPVSGQAIRKMLGRGSPIKACFQEDADDVLTSLASGMGMGPGIKSALLSIWDQAGEEGVLGRIEHSKVEDSAAAVQRPSLTFALDTQLEPYKKFMGSDVARTSGFGSRIILVEYDGDIKPTNHSSKIELNPNVLARLTDIFQAAKNNPVTFSSVGWEPDALQAFLDSDEINRTRMNKFPHVRGLLSRTPMNVNKFAALMAVIENPHDPKVTLEQFLWGQQFMLLSTDRIVKMVDDGETGSGESIREFTAVKAIKEYASLSTKTKRDTYRVPLSVIDCPELIPEKFLKVKLKCISCFKGTDNGKTTAQNVEQTIDQMIRDELLATVSREAIVLRFGTKASEATTMKMYTFGVSWDDR
jgi:hypothetical protein